MILLRRALFLAILIGAVGGIAYLSFGVIGHTP